MNNELLATKSDPRTPPDDRSAIQAQVAEMKAMVEHIDWLSGGKGQGWLQIALTPEDARQIITANKLFMEAFGRRDAAALANLYTVAGHLLPPNSQVVAGRDAIRTFWQGAMDVGLTQAQLETVEVEGHGETAVEVGTYTLRAGGGQVAYTGKYVVIWKAEGGTWKLHRDIWNTNQPASAK